MKSFSRCRPSFATFSAIRQPSVERFAKRRLRHGSGGDNPVKRNPYPPRTSLRRKKAQNHREISAKSTRDQREIIWRSARLGEVHVLLGVLAKRAAGEIAPARDQRQPRALQQRAHVIGRELAVAEAQRPLWTGGT